MRGAEYSPRPGAQASSASSPQRFACPLCIPGGKAKALLSGDLLAKLPIELTHVPVDTGLGDSRAEVWNMRACLWSWPGLPPYYRTLCSYRTGDLSHGCRTLGVA